MIRSLEFSEESTEDVRVIATMRLAILTTALDAHDAEGLRRLRQDFWPGGIASRLRVEIRGDDFTVLIEPLSGTVTTPRRSLGAFIRLEFRQDEVATALAMTPPHRFGGYK